MKECDILGEGSKYPDPVLHIFSGSRLPTSRIYAPVVDECADS